MAKQESFIKLRGTIGDLSFYKSRTGEYLVRSKGGVDGERIATDPNFQRTRENMSEFGRAASGSKLLRQQLNNLLFYFSDDGMRNRLTSLMHRIQKADTVNTRGERALLPENLPMLRGFEFNNGTRLQGLFSEPLTVAYDGAEGTVGLEIPPFNPQNSVTLLKGATHIRFVLAAATIDLSAETLAPPSVAYSDYIPLVGLFPGAAEEVAVHAAPADAVYTIVGIGVYQEVNGQYYPLNNGKFNALTVVDVQAM